MSGQEDFTSETSRMSYAKPYTSNHPIPTVQKYREHRHEIEDHQAQTESVQQEEDGDESKLRKAFDASKKIAKGEDEKKASRDPYPAASRNTTDEDSTLQDQRENPSVPPAPPAKDEKEVTPPGQGSQGSQQPTQARNNDSKAGEQKAEKSATDAAASSNDPRQKRKIMKNIKRHDGGREVTDPVTHLPVTIYDFTKKDLTDIPENEPGPGTTKRTATGLSSATKNRSELDVEEDELRRDHEGMQKLFPPPNFDDAQAELIKAYQFALTVGLTSVTVLATVVLVVWQMLNLRRQSATPQQSGLLGRLGSGEATNRIFVPISLTVGLCAATGTVLIAAIRGWLGKKVEQIFEDEIWDAAREQEVHSNDSDAKLPESVAWLNGVLASIWPLANPDMFTSVADMLEDVMQASLPKLVRMVSVDDIGQGSESIRILGIRWLPTGAASQSVDKEGKLESVSESDKQQSDRNAPGEGQVEDEADENKDGQDKTGEQALRQGMEAEQGDFVNLELAFAYRARAVGKSLRAKTKNAHLYLRFYLPGSIAIPVWVELRGLVGIVRMRLQLAPDPPFLNLMTLTFLGQPRADLSCVPLSKHNLNIMDVPLISSFVQSSIDAALAEYVAPKSLTLDLKAMLVGDDFKKDTNARGVIAIYIKSSSGFKEGDGGIGPFAGSSDGYVTVSWAKFGKPMASTRIIEKEQKPVWNEWAYILVTPEEINAGEKLRLQLWDSDKYTADDDLGRVQVDLKDIMQNSNMRNKMCDREDRYHGEDEEEKYPGTISWSVGFFQKLGITPEQFSKQTVDKNVKTKEDLKQQVTETAKRKLREATLKDESDEFHQQKVQNYKEREDALIISAPPPSDYVSGVLSIQVHNITGLELVSLQKKDKSDGDESDELPSSYCTIILNHEKIYRTRTKPKNAKPFFNAGTERFIRDWRSTEVILGVYDSRERENDALLGIVYLPLAKVFAQKSQVMSEYPIAGGIGYGRARVSMVFRAVELQTPTELLGWNYGTIEIRGTIKTHGTLQDVQPGDRLKILSNLSTVKFQPHEGQWKPKYENGVFLAVRKRYSCPLIIEFRRTMIGPDRTPAFAVFWLKDIPDEEEKIISMKIWKGGKDNLKRATSCGSYAGLQAGEKPLGELEVTMKFWRGLSGYHKRYANNGAHRDMKDVMEVLDTAHDEHEGGGALEEGIDSKASADGLDDEGPDATKKKLKHATTGSSSSSDGEESHSGIKGKLEAFLGSHNDPNDSSRGPLNQLRDYKDHHKQLHRQHRGIMQWKGARTMDWMATKLKHGKDRAASVFEHTEREPGVETEV